MFVQSELNSLVDAVASIPTPTLLSQPVEALQIAKVNDNYVIISALDSLAIGQGSDVGDNYQNVPGLYLFTENLLLSECFQFKQGIVSCHSVTLAGGQPTIDVSGKAGSSAGFPNEKTTPGTNGGKGDAGGQLSVYVEQTIPSLAMFRINAQGGNGGAGQPGTPSTPGANGGDGGKGGDVVLVISHYYLNWLAQLRSIAEMDSRDAQQPALEDLISGISKTDFSLVSLIATLKDAVAAIDDNSYQTSLKNAALQLQSLSTSYASQLLSQVDVTGGQYGVYGDGKSIGKNGIPGDPGSFRSILFSTPVGLANKEFPFFLLVHPSQCERLLNKIKLMYYVLDPVNNPESVVDLMSLLLRLQARTQLFANLEDQSPIAQYYAQNEALIGAINSVDRLRAIYDEVTQYLIRLKQGQDVFGYDSTHVPLGSFQFYQKLLNTVIANFSTIEAYYKEYFASLQTQTATMDAIKNARDQQSNNIAVANSQLDTLRDMAQQTATVIDSYQSILPPLKQDVEDKIKAFQDQLKKHFDFNFEVVFQSLTSLAFAPESKFMMVTQASEFLYNGITKVTDSKGEQIDKSYLISQLKAVQANVDSIQEGYQSLDNGLLQPDDPNAGKLLANEQQLLTFFQDFYNQFPQGLDDLKVAFDAYIQKIIERNNQILTYNAVVITILQTKQGIQDAVEARQNLNDEALQKMAPDLPDLVTFMASLYYKARTQVMETLDMTARAFRFWSLSDKNLIQIAYGGKSLPEINCAALAEAQTLILNSYSQAIESFGTNSSSFPANPLRDGLIIELPDYQVNQFKMTGQIILKIPEVIQITSRDESVFAGMANVRVKVVRAWIYGVSTANGVVQVQITHSGKEKITSPSGQVYQFTHQPVKKLFIYNTQFNPTQKSESIREDANFGLPQPAGNEETYAALGPFTQWLIAVDSSVNSELDLSKVTKVELEFHGTNFSFN